MRRAIWICHPLAVRALALETLLGGEIKFGRHTLLSLEKSFRNNISTKVLYGFHSVRTTIVLDLTSGFGFYEKTELIVRTIGKFIYICGIRLVG